MYSGLFSYILGMPATSFELGKKCRKSQRLGILEKLIESSETHN